MLVKLRSHGSATSSSTIADADSVLTSVALHQDKRTHRKKNYPMFKAIPTGRNGHHESDRELDQISDLTSKLFSSGSGGDGDDDDDDIPLGYSDLSSSSRMPSDAERLLSMWFVARIYLFSFPFSDWQVKELFLLKNETDWLRLTSIERKAMFLLEYQSRFVC